MEPFPSLGEGADARSSGATRFELAPPSEASGGEEGEAHGVDLASVDPALQRRLWEGFVTYVRQKKVTLGVCLISGTFESLEGDIVKIRFAKGCTFQKEQVEEATNRKFLKGMANKYFGRDFDVVCVSAGEERESRRKPRSSSVEEPPKPAGGVDDSPLFKKIIDDFDGEVIRYHPK